MDRGGPFKVFVGGLPQDCTNDILTDYFSKFGNITDVVVMTDRMTGRSRGFGFVSFDTEEAVDQIMAMHQDHQIQEKWVDCKRATAEGSKSGPKGGKGGFMGCGGCGGGDVRPGDWMCQACGASCFGSKDACFKCGAPKPQGYGGGCYNAAPPPSYDYSMAGYGAAYGAYGGYDGGCGAYGGGCGGCGYKGKGGCKGGKGYSPY
ncbi:unnamed protein product [Effrenium voratum]|nr:unnamed protein product [Effrenium voratum]